MHVTGKMQVLVLSAGRPEVGGLLDCLLWVAYFSNTLCIRCVYRKKIDPVYMIKLDKP